MAYSLLREKRKMLCSILNDSIKPYVANISVLKLVNYRKELDFKENNSFKGVKIRFQNNEQA